MYIEVKNSVKPVDYSKSMEALEERVEQVFRGLNNELLWILEHKPIYTAGTSYNSLENKKYLTNNEIKKIINNYINSIKNT